MSHDFKIILMPVHCLVWDDSSEGKNENDTNST